MLCVWEPTVSEEGVGSHGAGVIGAVSCRVWVLGTKFRFSRTESTLNC